MRLQVDIGGRWYSVSLQQAVDIAIPLQFGGPQPNTYDVPKASAGAFETEGFVGDTRRGGSCNFEEYRLISHCNGTHTECVGHIALERISLHQKLGAALIPATLISLHPVAAANTGETYRPALQTGDKLITKAALARALADTDKDFLAALVVRTLPNHESKTARRYTADLPPFFSIEAMQYIRTRGVDHLLVDIPSLDRAFDEGLLTAHHLFWEVEEGSHKVDPAKHSQRTVTEMIFVPDAFADGPYLLNLQTAPFVADAAPSRPVLYPLLPTD